MDIRLPNWHGTVEIAGIGGRTPMQGSIMQMLAQLLPILTQAKSRTDSSGAKIINITFSDQPITEATQAEMRETRAAEGLLSEKESARFQPLPGEDMLSMKKRLMNEGVMEWMADMDARIAFDYGPDESQLAFSQDERVARFIYLNLSDARFNAADPQEYMTLKRYVQQTYPGQSKSITFRG